MKITIDPAACEGHGRCVDLLPAVFEFGPDGYGKVRADAATPASEQLARVIALCPTQAISLDEED